MTKLVMNDPVGHEWPSWSWMTNLVRIGQIGRYPPPIARASNHPCVPLMFAPNVCRKDVKHTGMANHVPPTEYHQQSEKIHLIFFYYIIDFF